LLCTDQQIQSFTIVSKVTSTAVPEYNARADKDTTKKEAKQETKKDTTLAKHESKAKQETTKIRD
jgi:hypothetical protein